MNQRIQPYTEHKTGKTTEALETKEEMESWYWYTDYNTARNTNTSSFIFFCL